MKIALRIDDIGASSKQFEVYSKRFKGLGSVFFLKYLPWFRAWGPYPEMTEGQWEQVFELLRRFNARLTVGVTAGWVEKDGTLIAFPEKFEKQAQKLKEGSVEGLLEIANHGLTHCVVGRHLPRLFFSNRKYHREFWDWLDDKIHIDHIRESQMILQDYFEVAVTTFIPPGNVYTDITVQACEEFGINLINCQTVNSFNGAVRILDDENVVAFHDRELVLEGVEWLENTLNQQEDIEYCFVREL